MRKILIALTTLAMMSSAVYAEDKTEKEDSKLRVVSVGQQIRTQNLSGGADIDMFHFGTAVALKYGKDWDFDVFARKSWTVDGKDGIHGFGHRLEFNIWKKVNNNFSAGFRYRGEVDKDRYYLRTKYNYNIFSGWIDVAYQSNNGARDHEDALYAEAIPIGVTFGPVTLAYFVEVETWSLHTQEDGYQHYYSQQLKTFTNLYRGEKGSAVLLLGWKYDTDRDYDIKKREEYLGQKNVGWNQESKNSYQLGILWLYNVNESLALSGYVTWSQYDYDSKGGKSNTQSKKYTVETQTGWTYKF